ncbi:M56 family metallopeptidase [Nakamurella leprariae]|uniref:M56 family metallopeptidase n=1 Tax=Nakamurella leprariae TaxID=2803911 RepID=A0A939BYY5_9ACTN|nr:M56 family metallopeptidase [Nakamurella leprariae]MBM9467111.1 M56 family metallopeptidase [Nakamurella leprariae]
MTSLAGSSGIPAWALAGGLALLAVLLTGPVSALLARAHWPSRSPRAALVLWQAVCLGAGLSLVGAGVVIAVEPLGHNLATALITAGRSLLLDGTWPAAVQGWRLAAGIASAVIAAVLFSVLVRSAVLTVRRRRAHRQVLDLLTRPSVRAAPAGTGPAATTHERDAVLAGAVDVSILDDDRALAYTVPGWHSRIVLTAGLVTLLRADELTGVIEHERAHLRSRHDLVALPFQAWAVTLGRIPGVRAARAAAAGLIEMLADDAAVTRMASAPGGPDRRRILAGALARVALAGGAEVEPDAEPAGSPVAADHGPGPAGPSGVAGRVQRLLQERPPARSTAVLTYAVALVLVATPTVLLVIGWR